MSERLMPELERLKIYMNDYIEALYLKYFIERGHFFYGRSDGTKIDWADIPFYFPPFETYFGNEINIIEQ